MSSGVMSIWATLSQPSLPASSRILRITNSRMAVRKMGAVSLSRGAWLFSLRWCSTRLTSKVSTTLGVREGWGDDPWWLLCLVLGMMPSEACLASPSCSMLTCWIPSANVSLSAGLCILATPHSSQPNLGHPTDDMGNDCRPVHSSVAVVIFSTFAKRILYIQSPTFCAASLFSMIYSQSHIN